MNKKTTLSIGFFTLAFLVFTGNVFTNSSGVAGPLSGSPISSGQTCANCHGGGTITNQTIAISTDIPASGFQENTDYTITVKAQGNGGTSVKGGFNATIENSNAFVGSLSTTSGGGAIVLGNVASHNSSSNTFSGDSLVWKFKWNSGTAPGATIYAAVNFANGNGTTTGDAVKTASSVLTKSSIGISEFELVDWNVFPNPASNDLNIQLDIPNSGELKLDLHDGLGRKISGMNNSNVTAGKLNFTEDISNLSSGIYFLHINFEGNLKTEKIIIQ